MQTSLVDLNAQSLYQRKSNVTARSSQLDFGAMVQGNNTAPAKDVQDKDDASSSSGFEPPRDASSYDRGDDDQRVTRQDDAPSQRTDDAQALRDKQDARDAAARKADDRQDAAKLDARHDAARANARHDAAKADAKDAAAKDAADKADARKADARDAADKAGARDAADKADARDATRDAQAAKAAGDDQQGDKAADAKAPQDGGQPLDPQEALQAMLATGGQVATPQPTAQADAKAAAGQADANAAVTGAGQAPAQAATAQDAKAAQPQAQQAQAQGAAQQQAKGPAVPAALQQAANAMGPIKVTVEKGAPKIANLSIQLLSDQAKAGATDANAATQPATPTDGADASATPSLTDIFMAAELPPQQDHDQHDAKSDDPQQDPTAIVTTTPTQTENKAEATAAKQAPAPATTAHEVMTQIFDRGDQLKAAQQSAVKLQLYPEHLGKMEIRVVSHDGVISAQLSADSQHVKSLLEGQVVALQRSFQELGLKVDKVEVTLNSANLSDFSGNQQQAGANFTDGRQFQQQGQQQPYHFPQHNHGNGYEQWLGEAPAAEHYATLDQDTAINYVA